jgi:hypothetical protein
MAKRTAMLRALCCLSGVVAVFAAVPVTAQELNHVWSRTVGDASGAGIDGVATDANGNVFIVGNFGGTVTLGGPALTSVGDLDIFLAKFGPDGNHLWSQSFGGLDIDFANDIAVDTDGNPRRH